MKKGAQTLKNLHRAKMHKLLISIKNVRHIPCISYFSIFFLCEERRDKKCLRSSFPVFDPQNSKGINVSVQLTKVHAQFSFGGYT